MTRQPLLTRMSRRQMDGYCGVTTRVEVELTMTMELDVLCAPAGDPGDDHASLATRAAAMVAPLVPQVTHPQTGEPVECEVWYYGEVGPHGCPKVGYGVAEGEEAAGRRMA